MRCMLEESIGRGAYLTLERSTIGCPLGVVVSTSMVGLAIYMDYVISWVTIYVTYITLELPMYT